MEIYYLLNRIFNITPKFTNSSRDGCTVLYCQFKRGITLVARVEVGDLEIMLSEA